MDKLEVYNAEPNGDMVIEVSGSRRLIIPAALIDKFAKLIFCRCGSESDTSGFALDTATGKVRD